MNRKKNTIKKRLSWKVWGFIGVLIVIGVAVYLRSITPEYERISSLPDPDFTSRAGTVNPEIVITLPENLPSYPQPVIVAKARLVPLATETITRVLTNPTQIRENVWRSTQDSALVVINTGDNVATYTNSMPNGDHDISSTLPVRRDPAFTAAQEFLKKLYPDTSFVELTSEKFFAADEQQIHIEEVEESDANLVEFSFSYVYQGEPVVLGASPLPSITVMVNSTNDVIKAVFPTQTLQIQQQAQAPTILARSALTDVGRFTVIKKISESFEPEPLQAGKTLVIDTVKLEYRYSEKNGWITPFYRASGIITLANEQNMVEIIAPAAVIE